MSKSSKTQRQPFPVGRVAGLLTGSLVTVIGVVIGLDPDTVLWRAAIAAAGMMLVGSALAKIMEMVMT